MKIYKLEKIIYFIKSKLVSKNFWIPLMVSFTLGLALKYILMIWGINIFEQPFHFATLSALGIIAFIRQLCAVCLQSNTGELITLHMESGANAGGLVQFLLLVVLVAGQHLLLVVLVMGQHLLILFLRINPVIAFKNIISLVRLWRMHVKKF